MGVAACSSTWVGLQLWWVWLHAVVIMHMGTGMVARRVVIPVRLVVIPVRLVMRVARRWYPDLRVGRSAQARYMHLNIDCVEESILRGVKCPVTGQDYYVTVQR